MTPNSFCYDADFKCEVNDLPDDILLHIFALLSSDDLSRANRVCRRWNDISNDPFVWQRLICRPDTASSLERFMTQRMSPYTKSLTVYNPLKPCWSKGCWTMYPDVFTPYNCKLLVQLGPNLKRLEIWNPFFAWNHKPGLIEMGRFPSNKVEFLTLVSCYFMVQSSLSVQNFQNLKSLAIIHGAVTKELMLALTELPNLEELHFGKEIMTMIHAEPFISYVISAFNSLGKQIKRLRFTEFLFSGHSLQHLLLKAYALEKLILYECQGLAHDMFVELVRRNPSACPALREIECTYIRVIWDEFEDVHPYLTHRSLPKTWNTREIALTLWPDSNVGVFISD